MPSEPLLSLHDLQAVVRQGRTVAEETRLRERAAWVWRTAGRCHLNSDFRFNSQSTCAVLTERVAIGGRAWPSVNFHDVSHETAFVLWANSTLGLLLHWWVASKQQSGRGSITLSRLPDLPVYDFLATLTTAALGRRGGAGRRIQDAVDCAPSTRSMETAATSTQIDRFALGEVFGLADHGAALDLLRRKLAREPSITGGRER